MQYYIHCNGTYIANSKSALDAQGCLHGATVAKQRMHFGDNMCFIELQIGMSQIKKKKVYCCCLLFFSMLALTLGQWANIASYLANQ